VAGSQAKTPHEPRWEAPGDSPEEAEYHSSLAKMGWVGWFQMAKKEKEQTTGGNDQDAADPNQFRRHEKYFL
jgi:hypothetical protein